MALTGLLLDSNVLIDQLNGIPAAQVFLWEHRLSCLVSPVTRAEVLAGAVGAEWDVAAELLDLFPCLDLDRASGDRAGWLCQELGLKAADAFQLALAEIHNCRLVTRNTRDFKPAKHPRVLVPYTL